MSKGEKRTIEMRLDDNLRGSPCVPCGVTLPVVIDYKLEMLVEAADAVKTSRSEIVAMLIAMADASNPEELEEKIMSYRKMTVGDVLPENEVIQ